MRSKKLLSVLTAGLIAAGGAAVNMTAEISAADISYKFDLGGSYAGGFTQVSASDGYNKSKGYGFSGSGVKNVPASGSGAFSDAVQFTDNSTVFCADLPKGLYRVSVTLGNTNRTSVYMENMLQIVNMTGNNAYDSILVPVTDGQLNVRAAAGKEGYAFTISEIDIQKVSDDAELPKTVWVCGDSTVCNYYPLETSTQAGWGQVLSKYIDTSKWQVRDMASSGQFAKGFLGSGQFTPIEYYGKQGDIFFISIGINDNNPNYTNEQEYYESVTEMTKRAVAKGMTVYLVKQQGRAGDASNKGLSGRWFGGTLDRIGEEQGVKVLDLFNAFHDYCVSIGQEETNKLYMTGDTLHPNRQGAMKLAELVSRMVDWGDGVKPVFGGGAVLETNKKFYIKNKNSGLYLSADGELSNLTNVIQSDIRGNSSLWEFVDKGGGYYMVKSAAGDFYLDLNQGKTEMGTNIQIYSNSNSNAQLFKFLPRPDGSYVIATRATGDKSCVEVVNAYTDAGANVQQWEINGHPCQSWILEEAGDTPQTVKGVEMDTQGMYLIRNRNSGMYLSSEGEASVNANVIQSDCGISPGSVWQFVQQENGCYRIKNAADELYLDSESGADAGNKNIRLNTMSEGDTQLFKFVGSENYSIHTGASEYSFCVDAGASTDSGSNVFGNEKNRSTSQLWSIEPVELSGSIISQELVMGDLNDDGAVNCIDYIIMKRRGSSISGKELHAADTNGDGMVNGSDLSDLMGFLAKKNELKGTRGFYYADEASFSRGIREEVHPGFRGKSYVNLENMVGSFMEWRVSVPEEGDYRITLSTANGSSDPRPMMITVNGKNEVKGDFPASGGWDTWAESSVTVHLSKGVNTLRLTSASEGGGPNIDHMTIEKSE